MIKLIDAWSISNKSPIMRFYSLKHIKDDQGNTYPLPNVSKRILMQAELRTNVIYSN